MLAPAIPFCDEIEKALAGATHGQQGDSGVASRLFGSLLSWLNDHESDVFFVGTCNDISRLPPEFSRAERFDGVFFIDLPGAEEKPAIWSIYLARFGLDDNQKIPDDARWTGAEIRSCCRLAALLDLPLTKAAEHVVPVAVTAADSVQQLRQWARGRCLDAASAGIYRGDTQLQSVHSVSEDRPLAELDRLRERTYMLADIRHTSIGNRVLDLRRGIEDKHRGALFDQLRAAYQAGHRRRATADAPGHMRAAGSWRPPRRRPSRGNS